MFTPLTPSSSLLTISRKFLSRTSSPPLLHFRDHKHLHSSIPAPPSLLTSRCTYLTLILPLLAHTIAYVSHPYPTCPLFAPQRSQPSSLTPPTPPWSQCRLQQRAGHRQPCEAERIYRQREAEVFSISKWRSDLRRGRFGFSLHRFRLQLCLRGDEGSWQGGDYLHSPHPPSHVFGRSTSLLLAFIMRFP